MLTIIHGDDIVASRKYFLDLKEKHPDAISFDGEKVNLTDLAQSLEGAGLFADSKTVMIEQLISKKSRGGAKKKESELSKIIDYLEKQSDENTIVLWENKELERSVLLLFKRATVKIFKLPQTLFALLDGIKPGNGKALIPLFHQTVANTEVEMVFFMLVRQVRLLLALTPPPHPNPLPQGERGISVREISRSPSPFVGPDEGGRLLDRGGQGRGEGAVQIDEIKRMQPWQKDKLKKQAAAFGVDRLLALHSALFTLEVGQKTGTLSSPLQTSIDFLLLEI